MVMPRPRGRAKKIASQVIPALKEKIPIFKDVYNDETFQIKLMNELSALPPFSLDDSTDQDQGDPGALQV